jgi:hypothetical protein
LRARHTITCLLITALACILLGGCIGRPPTPKPGSIMGTVENALSHEPVAGAMVKASTGPSTATGSDGAFILSDVPAGEVTLDVSCQGYNSNQAKVIVPAGKGVQCAIELHPRADELVTVTGYATVANNYNTADFRSVADLGARPTGRSLSTLKQNVFDSQSAFDCESDAIQVRLQPGIDRAEIADNLNQAGYEIVDELPLTGIIIVRPMRRTRSLSVENESSTLGSIPGIDWAYPDYPVYATAVPNDPLYQHQWHYSAISLPEAWDITTGEASPVIVAVIDTGIRPEHEDLLGKTVPGWDYVDGDADPTDLPSSTKNYSHGTHVAGTVAAATDNGIGVAGTSWGAQIMPIRVLGPDGSGSSSNVAEGIMFAVENGADVINLSLGLAAHPGPAMEGAVQYAYSRGVTLVAASGNDNGARVLYPAAFPEVIAVSATDSDNELAGYSNCGPEITVAAPGGTPLYQVLSTGYSSATPATDKYFLSFGTSMATPHVSGLAALLISARGRMSPASIAELISATSMDLGGDGYDTRFGAGLINAYAALAGAAIDRALFAIKDSSGRWITESVYGTRDRTFTIPSVPIGDYVLVGFIDLDGDGQVTRGDFYGEAQISVASPGTVWVPRLLLNYVDGAAETNITLRAGFNAASRLP